MPRKKAPQKPRDVDIIVTGKRTGTYTANKLRGAYETDINKALKTLEQFLETRFPDDFTIKVVDR